MALKTKPHLPVSVSFAASLRFDKVCHRYDGGEQVLHDISLEAEPGKVLCLLGPSGSGKSTLLRLAAGIEKQTSGCIKVNERDVAGPDVFLPPEKRPIGLVFQDFALFPHLTIIENVRFGLTQLSHEEGNREALRALKRMGLEHYADAFPHLLSGGEQQRVALARALAPRPSILLMDEPFSGLDTRLRDAIRAETLAALRESGATAIIVTHDAEEAMRMGDRIALINDGHLEQVGAMSELYYKPKSLFAAAFFSELNAIDAVAAHGKVNTPLGIFDAPQGIKDGPVTIAIRLNGIDATVPEAGAKSIKHGFVRGRLISRRFLGETDYLVFAVEGLQQLISARMPSGKLPPSTTDVLLTTNSADVLVFEK